MTPVLAKADKLLIVPWLGIDQKTLLLILLGLFILFTMVIRTPGQVRAGTTYGYANVIDGDTIEVGGIYLRMHGMDAPEKDQTCKMPSGALWKCGTAATQHLKQLINGSPVTYETLDMDKYGRTVARIWANGVDLSGAMVRDGMAVAYRRYSLDYVPLEDEARSNRRGIWAGECMEPEQWRRRTK